ncbi:MAG TPA: capsule assembly Wzi family protein, partial [Acidisarcina sp.]
QRQVFEVTVKHGGWQSVLHPAAIRLLLIGRLSSLYSVFLLIAVACLFSAVTAVGQPPIDPSYVPTSPVRYANGSGSTYIPMDSWIYPALDRLSSLGYLDTAFFGLRPWTRLGVEHMLEQTADRVQEEGNDEAQSLYLAVEREVGPDLSENRPRVELDSVYGRGMEISGSVPITNSFEFGQTVINDEGRPYAHGFNGISGFHARGEAGHFSLNVRGEFQHAGGYAPLSIADQTALLTGGYGFHLSTLTPIDVNGVGNRNNFRLIDANLSFHALHHEISVGKSEMWWGPGQGGAFLFSTNAEPLYTLRFNMVDPIRVPILSRLLGPMRWDHYFGDQKGHVNPNRPWIFGDKISFHPTSNLEIGFSRSCSFAGKGYSPLTLGTFRACFFSTGDFAQAGARQFDVGDRRGDFDFRWRLPHLEKSVTIYTDSNADDDPSPLANPYRTAWGPGIYVSHLPGLSKVDFRFEAPFSNIVSSSGINYSNHAYRDGFTNKGFIMGHWIGRESSGYQAWLTYWLSAKEQVQVEYRDVKLATHQWPAGGTQTDLSAKVVKRLAPGVELNARFQWERYCIPDFQPGIQHDYTSTFQVTWFPKLEK